MKFVRVVLLGFLFIISSCGQRYYLTPAVQFNNIGDDYIYYLEGEWNGYSLKGHRAGENSPFDPGNSGSETFAIKKPSDMFGPVYIQFQNAKGEIIKKDFIFKNENLPENYFVVIFLTQNDIEYFVEGKNEPQEVTERNKKLYPLSMEYRAICLDKPIQHLYELNGGSPVEKCRPHMPIHKPENAAKLKQYHKLQAEYDAKLLKNREEYQKRKLSDKNQ